VTDRTALVAAVLAVAVLTGGLAALVASPPGERATAPPASQPPAATAPRASEGPVAAAKPRPGRAISLDDAFKELDLIRPSRQKLAEDFTLTTPDGGSFRLADHRGKVVFVNFWATWCPPCKEEMPAMERLYRQHRDGAFAMVAVSVDADPAVVPPYVQASGLTFPIGLDPKTQVANSYGVRALPASFIIDRQGHMAALALGPRRWDGDAAHSLIEGLARR
jgi:peroxiredoxin